jgi:hypothetical protein
VAPLASTESYLQDQQDDEGNGKLKGPFYYSIPDHIVIMTSQSLRGQFGFSSTAFVFDELFVLEVLLGMAHTAARPPR